MRFFQLSLFAARPGSIRRGLAINTHRDGAKRREPLRIYDNGAMR